MDDNKKSDMAPATHTTSWTKLKYYGFLKDIADFPPKYLMAKEVIGYRIVKSDISDRINFTPTAFIKRPHNKGGVEASLKSTDYALSMFESLEQLEAKARAIVKTVPMFLKRRGDHFAELQLKAQDGACTKANRTGHFDFYEDSSFNGTDAVSRHERMVL